MSTVTNSSEANFISDLATAISDQTVWPSFQSGLDLDQAYALQHVLTRVLSANDVGGIKAGVTDPNIQKFLGLNHALLGSIYGSTRHEIGGKIPYLESRMIETEIALKIDANGEPIAIAPAIEFVRLKFAAPTDMNAANLVVCNLGTEGYITGEFQQWKPELGDISITLEQDSQPLNQTNANTVLDGVERAAQWMHGEAIARGFHLTEQTVFLGGLCGAAVPANVGQYTANYHGLEPISFSIV